MNKIIDSIKADVESGALSLDEAIDSAFYAGYARENATHLQLPGDIKLMMTLCAMGENGPPVAIPSIGRVRAAKALTSIVTTLANPRDCSESPEGAEEICIVAAICLTNMGVRAGMIDEVAARRNEQVH